jgi:hypothetical protein
MSFILISVIVLVNFLIAMMSGTFGNIQDATSIEFRFLKSQAVHESFTENISLPPPFTVIVEVLYWLSQLIRLPRKISQRCNPASFEPETDWWICSKCHHMIESSRGERVSTRDIADKLLADSQDSRLLHLQILSLFDNNEVCPVCLSPKQSVKVSTAMREVLARNVWIIFTSPALFPCSFLIELYSKYQKSLTKDLILKGEPRSNQNGFQGGLDWQSIQHKRRNQVSNHCFNP